MDEVTVLGDDCPSVCVCVGEGVCVRGTGVSVPQ